MVHASYKGVASFILNNLTYDVVEGIDRLLQDCEFTGGDCTDDHLVVIGVTKSSLVIW